MFGNKNYLLYLLLFIWFVVNLIQASYTEILSDEAYYGLYGKFPALGYFDHPPLVAYLTRISSLFFNGNLGIRFVSVILQPLTLLFIWKIVGEREPDRKKVLTFFLIAGSICVFVSFGFFTTPDVPLLFFSTLFIYSYKQFLSFQGWKNILVLSLSMAGMMYSKYHGAIVIGLIVLSNLKLVKMYRFWVAGILAVILYAPHIWWQVSNDFPSFRFHFLERAEGFSWKYLLEYFPNQLAVFNPFVLGASSYIMIKYRPRDVFERGLYTLVAGFQIFFCIAAIRGHVEPHWTIASSIPMIIILYNYSKKNEEMLRFLKWTLVPVILVLFIGRVLLLSDLEPVHKLGFSGKEGRYRHIESVAKDIPVIFLGSYLFPSLYTFFTGKESLAINNMFSRETQFDIWQFEKKYNNKPAFICGFGEGESRFYKKGEFEFYGYFTDSLQTVNRIAIDVVPHYKVLHPGDSLSFKIIFKSGYGYDIDLNHHRFPVTILMTFVKNGELKTYPVELSKPIHVIHAGETLERQYSTIVPELEPGSYHFGICLETLFSLAINRSFYVTKIIRE